MAKDQVTTVKDAVHQLQLALLEGIKDQNQLFAAGSLMSKGDYQDVVTERTIGNMCGYPLCSNSLPSERPWKGRYRISLKEHKVYDLQETYMYCSTDCVVNSGTFAGSLPLERSSVFSTSRINEVLSLFEGKGLDLVEEAMGSDGDLGFSKLKIQEKTETKGEEVSLEDWIGPSNAIEGYVPKREHNVKPLHLKDCIKGSESNDADLKVADGAAVEDRDPESVISNAASKSLPVRNDESFELLPYERPQSLPSNTEYRNTEDRCGGSGKPLQNNRESYGDVQLNKSKQGHKPKRSNQKKDKGTNFFNMDFTSTIITQDEYSVSKSPSGRSKNDVDEICKESNGKSIQKNAGGSLAMDKSSTSTMSNPKENSIDSTALQKHASSNGQAGLAKSTFYSGQSHEGPEGSSCTSTTVTHCGEAVVPSKLVPRSALKSSSSKKSGQKVTWADENKTGTDSGDLCEFNELSNTGESSGTLSSADAGENDSTRLASANAVAIAMSQAAEAVASGQSDVADAVSEAGIVVLPQPGAPEREGTGEIDDEEAQQAPKWPKKSDISSTDALDSEDSWFDSPPEGFSLTLSPFATMWNALFTWMTCSSLAYIYGKDDSLHEDYLSVNGREYPRKIFLPDGRSSEIEQTMAGCLARALPDVILYLNLATPTSVLQKGLARLLETMSFMDALPPFRMKQWQVIVLIFLEALSIQRIPGLVPYLTTKRSFIPKLLDGAQMSIEEYEILKEIVLPLSSEA